MLLSEKYKRLKDGKVSISKGKHLNTKVSGYPFEKRATCDSCRMAPTSCDTPDASGLTEAAQLLGKKHIFLVAKAKLPVAVCTLGIKYNTEEEQFEGPTVSTHLAIVSLAPTHLSEPMTSHTPVLRRLSCQSTLRTSPSVSTVIPISEASVASTT